MLGLVPDPAIMLDVSALKRYRQSARLKQSELAARLAARGWQIATKDVFAWETKSAAGLCPALIRAIAEELGVEAEKVMLRRDLAKETTVEKVAKTPWFVDLVWDLSRKVQITFGVAQSDLLAQMSATANRGSDLTEEQWREVLEQLVSNRTPRRSDNE
ncbi:MAG: hypothetical protein FWG11_02750 [Promicromonosporaceae bacterium]|nr:hypothetical protein [Promicromonosporaceae bacterium]